MSRGRGKSTGWAAFDLIQRQKQCPESEIERDPFPSLQKASPSLLPSENLPKRNGFSGRPFSSLLLPSADFSDSMQNVDDNKLALDGTFSRKFSNKDDKFNSLPASEKLKGLHSWADISLIEDILVAVNNDVDEASSLLKAMVSNDSFEENDKISKVGILSCSSGFSCNKKREGSIISHKTEDLSDLSSALDDIIRENKTNLTDGNDSSRDKLSYDVANLELDLGWLKSVPIEPDWEEEDDPYLSHRRDALATMRSASQHSRAATNAFLRGDHLSAQRHSLKSQEDWSEAKKLNAKAAKEILSIRNSENNIWRLDLHGLHAEEAVLALQEHLWKIETQSVSNRSVSPIKDKMKGIVCSPSLECFTENVNNKDRSSSRQRPTSLQVITGVGKHSRGPAALPIAVTSFLNENGYRYEEPRPGIITVRPKFRR